MKKIITSILLLSLLAISLCACNNVKETKTDKIVNTAGEQIETNTENTRKPGEDLVFGNVETDTKEKFENTLKKINEAAETTAEEIQSLTEDEKSEETTSESEVEEPINENTIYEEKILFRIEMMNGDIMEGELYPNLAPITVENFVNLIRSNFYEGLIFHRVIPGFMIQGGGYNENLEEKEASEIKGEFTENGIENKLSHTRGIISMARTVIPDSASSQFFIVHEDSTFLDGKYAAFGKITSGLEIVDKIATTETESVSNVMSDVPKDAQIIKAITIIE